MSLTRHPSGSLRELLSISLPLMLTSLSFFLMIFVDRLFLAAYDIQAMTAAVNASIVGVTCFSGLSLIASIAEVFVGRRFGAGKMKTLGAPVWQMLWLSLFSFLIFLPLAFFSTEWIFGEGRELESVYLKWLLYFAPLTLAFQAIAAFFIGQGKTGVIARVAVITNVVNIFFDYLLIFGFEGWIPPLGIEGAAIATCIGAFFQTGYLFFLFLGKNNREEFGSFEWRFKYPLFKETILIGIPAGVSITIELFGWSLFYEMMKHLGENHITLAGIFQSLLMLLFFIPEGLHKGVIAIIANYIGENKEWVIPKVLYSSLIFIALFLAVAFSVTPFAVMGIREGFFGSEVNAIDPFIYVGWLAVVFYMTFESVRVIQMSLLTAYKETRYIMLSGVASVFLFIAFPFVLFLSFDEPSEVTALLLALLFPLGHAALLYMRSRKRLSAPLLAINSL